MPTYTTQPQDQVHVFVTDKTKVAIHTRIRLHQGGTLIHKNHQINIEIIKEAKSRYYEGFKFYEINFK